MPDDEPSESWTEEGSPPTDEVAHDDIMQRLVEYQRSLREGADPMEAAAEFAAGGGDPGRTTDTANVIDTTSEEPSAETPSPHQAASTAESPEDTATVWTEEEPQRVSLPETSAEEATEAAGQTEERSSATGASSPELEDRLARLEHTLETLRSKLGELRRNFQEMAVAADDRLADVEDEIAEVRREPTEE